MLAQAASRTQDLTPAHGLVQAGAARYPLPTDRKCPNVNLRSLSISFLPCPYFVGENVRRATNTLPNGKQRPYHQTISVKPMAASPSCTDGRAW